MMSNTNKKEFKRRLQSLLPTHDMKAFKDPATQHMKGKPAPPPLTPSTHILISLWCFE